MAEHICKCHMTKTELVISESGTDNNPNQNPKSQVFFGNVFIVIRIKIHIFNFKKLLNEFFIKLNFLLKF